MEVSAGILALAYLFVHKMSVGEWRMDVGMDGCGDGWMWGWCVGEGEVEGDEV